MKKIKTNLLMIKLLGVLLITCINVEAQSIEYYKSHIKEAQSRAKECKNLDQTDKSVELDCDNAVSALTSKMIDNGMKKAPPYGTSNINMNF